MKRGFCKLFAITTLIGGAMFAQDTSVADDNERLDFTGVSTVVIHGADSRIDLSTRHSGHDGIRVTDNGTRLCGIEPAIKKRDATLEITLIRKGVRIWGQCDHIVVLSLPDGLSVSVEQSGTVVNAVGRYRTLSIDSPKAVVTFNGQAQKFAVTSEQAVVNAEFERETVTELVRIDADKLVANLGFHRETILSYAIDADLSVFSKSFEDTPGGSTRVEIKGQMLKGSLYARDATPRG